MTWIDYCWADRRPWWQSMKRISGRMGWDTCVLWLLSISEHCCCFVCQYFGGRMIRAGIGWHWDVSIDVSIRAFGALSPLCPPPDWEFGGGLCWFWSKKQIRRCSRNFWWNWFSHLQNSSTHFCLLASSIAFLYNTFLRSDQRHVLDQIHLLTHHLVSTSSASSWRPSWRSYFVITRIQCDAYFHSRRPSTVV